MNAAESHIQSRVSEREATLRTGYGELLGLADLAMILRYPSVQAIQKARIRGTLMVPTFQIAGRRGWYATARAVAEYLDGLDATPHTTGGLA